MYLVSSFFFFLLVSVIVNMYFYPILCVCCNHVCRQLSRHLVGLWVTGHPTAMGLLKRILVPFFIMAFFCIIVAIDVLCSEGH